jgi:hypothetical protein
MSTVADAPAMTHPSIERRTGRKHRTLLQKRADGGLPEHPYRIELAGSIGSLHWPSICASCGADTDDLLTVRKVFVRPRYYTRGPRSYRRLIVRSARIPYCEACAARHRALVPPRSLLGDLWRLIWPVLIPMIGAGYFFQLSLRIALAEDSGGPNARYLFGVPALFGAILVWCLVIAWYSSRSARVERQTEVTRACDYSDDVSWFWERERRIYAMSSERFARAFADANAERVWSTDDDQRSSRYRVAVYTTAAVAAVLVWAVVVLAPL